MIRRLFVAAEIPPASQARLYAAAALLRERAAQARVTRRENFHITLAFLGETDREADIRRAMDETRVPAFSLSIRGAGRFTGRGQASIPVLRSIPCIKGSGPRWNARGLRRSSVRLSRI